MKRWIISGLVMIMTVSGTAQAGIVPDPTASERQRSIETGLCVVREDQDVAVRMLLAESNTAVQNRFMVAIRKCCSIGENVFPNVIMGTIAEKVMADRIFSVEDLNAPETMSKKFLNNPTNRLFACAIAAKPAFLTKMLRTDVGSAAELDAIQDFRLALIECNATRGRDITPINIRAGAARAAFAMANVLR